MADRAVLIPQDLSPAVPPPGSRIHVFEGTSMGTTWSARVAAGHVGDVQPALQAELDAIVAQMSHWDPDSLLSRYNRAPAGTWIALPAQFFDVVDYALWAHMASGGAYDPAAGALVDLWGFGAARRYDHTGFYAPDETAIERALDERAAARLSFDRDGRRLLQPGGLRLDLSSIAKGYAVDCLAQCLERRGLSHYLVEVGGELRGAGVKPDGHPWWVEIEGVPDSATPQAVVALHGVAIATSGDYRQYFEHGARRVSHTLDPRTGRPVDNDIASVTVLAPTCMEADALSTVLAVLGPDDGLAFAEARALAARVLVRRAGMLEETTTPAWKALLQ
ncbi:FAD:protein FMN transferase [Telluria mixta]|uniref:FAD:protein FMN transferase n=1 Tax=Telluria mixta TaxID=34071 RepID=A0ABT2BU17_9BURK|nr:FAD:protein FMN transferase [Telluria mixta]MCS0628616.1 FAD:protein FMN transferase [Telluria mixta]WEM93282.1 FAD:protein FMN transferase [Telluria mixta]